MKQLTIDEKIERKINDLADGDKYICPRCRFVARAALQTLAAFVRQETTLAVKLEDAEICRSLITGLEYSSSDGGKRKCAEAISQSAVKPASGEERK